MATVVPLLGQLCIITVGSSPESSLAIGLQNLDTDSKQNGNAWSLQPIATPGTVETTAVLPVDVDSVFVAKCRCQFSLLLKFGLKSAYFS